MGTNMFHKNHTHLIITFNNRFLAQGYEIKAVTSVCPPRFAKTKPQQCLVELITDTIGKTRHFS